jgi:peptidoglycan L-alanyl-D-glutamate endopeptidase CwlK
VKVDISIPNRDTALIYPPLVVKVNTGIAAATAAGYPFAIFEGYRSPERQTWLYDQGRTRPGRAVTKARAWESGHQAGVAIDLALYRDGKWSWDFNAADVRRYFTLPGLEFLDFESAHVQLTGGMGGKALAALARDHGIAYVWELLSKRLKEKDHA